MHETRSIMGMPITVAVAGGRHRGVLEGAFALFETIDARFSTYRADSDISRFNRGEISESNLSAEVKDVFDIARATGDESAGFFDMKRPDGTIDPSGIVKGWAIKKAADLLRGLGEKNFFVDAGGDIQCEGRDALGADWRVGIRNPFRLSEVIKIVEPKGRGIATSGSYARGAHIYNPHAPRKTVEDVLSITVIGPDVLEADRFATAAFAMGGDGVYFIENLPGFEAYQVNALGIATQTSGFGSYVVS